MAALFGFQVLPFVEDVGGGVRFGVAEDVRVAAHHFEVDTFDDVANVELAGGAGQLGVKDDLEEQVAELLGKFRGVGGVERVEDFVGLFEQVGAQSFVSLLAVPGAALGGEEFLLESDQVVEASGHGKILENIWTVQFKAGWGK